MANLYITQSRSTVRATGESLVVTVPPHHGPESAEMVRGQTTRIPSASIEGISLVGSVHITADALQHCFRNGIAIAWLSRGGRLLGRVEPSHARCGDLKLAQYRTYLDSGRRLALARQTIGAKLANALILLERVQNNDPRNAEIKRALAATRALVPRVAVADRPEVLLGLEGAATRAYFCGYAAAFRGGITFAGRKRQPPPDPANALLSFGYVLLCNLLVAALEARGLDPSIGFFHELRSGKPCLALDLMEEIRQPLVDAFVLTACNLRLLRPEHFEVDEETAGGVRLTREGLKLFFPAWEKALSQEVGVTDDAVRSSFRDLVRRQVDRIALAMRGTADYVPVLLRR